MKRGPRTLCAGAVLATVACGGSETVLPIESSITTVALTATSTDASAVAVRSETAALNVEEAGLSMQRLTIAPCAADAAPLAHDDYPVDLAFDPPALASFESGVDDYCGIRVEVTPRSGAEPPVLTGRGIYVWGTRFDGVPFEIRSTLSFDVELRVPPETPFPAHLALGFDLATWFDGADVSGASVVDGIAVIDSMSNPEVLAAFEANSASAVALYADADRDGVLDADELVPIATER